MSRSFLSPLEIVLEPLENKREIALPHFPPYPRMYLELFENKEKILPKFRGKEFIPVYPSSENINFDGDGDEVIIENGSETKVPMKKEKPSPAPKVQKPQEKEKKEHPSEDKTETKELKEPSNLKDPVEDPLSDEFLEDPIAKALRKSSRSVGSRQKKSPQSIPKKDKESVLSTLPPSLADLGSGGAFDEGGIKNLNYLSKKDQDQEQKARELLFKFELLKRSYPNEEFPKFTVHSDPEYMEKIYESTLRNFRVTDNVNKYKKYLMYAFMGAETVIGEFLGFDMKGFTKQQVIEMSSYEKLLIELGEKTYVPKTSWPVELRLLGLVVFNAAGFVASRMLFKSSGTDVLGALNAPKAPPPDVKKGQKMAGPSVRLDDLPPPPQAPPRPTESVSFVSK